MKRPPIWLLPPCLAVAAACATAAQLPGEVRVRIWIRAFIPSEHPSNPGYIKRTSNGHYVIEAPENPLLTFLGAKGSCFETDNRSFESSPVVSSRVTVEKIFIVKGRDIIGMEDPPGRPAIRIGSTDNVECDSGALLARKLASADGTSISPVKNGNFVSTVGIMSKTSNPFYPSLITPKIDIDAVVERRFLKRDIRVYGAVGIFPAFEAYYSIDDGPAIKLFTLPPADRTSAIDLVDFGTGFKTRNFEATIPLK
jgi:hypothetical protein